MHRIFKTVLLALAALMPWSTYLAENMFDANSGNLFVSVLRADANLAYSAAFNLVSTTPPIWALESIEETDITSRTEAQYHAATNTISVPEISIEGSLYDLSFRVTENCDASACLEPELDTLQELGRSGSEVFTTPVSSASTFSCASCHAIAETDGFAADGFHRPGHPLLNATKRPNYKNGELGDMLSAVNICLTEWMNTDPWTENDSDWTNLFNWLDDQSTLEQSSAIAIEIVAPPADLSGGSETAGQELFNKSCIVCHGQNGEGTQLAPKVTERGLSAAFIGSRVRTGGPVNSQVYSNLSGGVMPFWGADRLSDGELADIVAFVMAEEFVPDMVADDSPLTPSGCTSTSLKIGQTLNFTTRFHDVSGMATIIDDCTIELTNFNFDGGGIDVHIYAGTNLSFHLTQGGFSLLGNLLGTRFENATLRITLPVGVTLDDFDSLSVWCVPVGTSFGEGQFSS